MAAGMRPQTGARRLLAALLLLFLAAEWLTAPGAWRRGAFISIASSAGADAGRRAEEDPSPSPPPVGGLGPEAELVARFRKMQRERQPESDPRMPAPQYGMHQKPDCGEELYKGSGKLNGKVALITGGDSGIGRAVAIAFAREGADVAIVYFADYETQDAEDTKRICEAAGRRCITIQTDVSKRENCKDAVNRCVSELGGLTTLVNNAACQYLEDSLDSACEDLQKVFSTNIFSNFYLAAEAVKHFKEDTGCAIIFTTSVGAYNGDKGPLAYAATKAAQVGLMRSLSKRFQGRLFRVNGVAPGPIWTPFIVGTFPAEEAGSFGDSNPTGRSGQPAELAPAYVYLASSDSSYVDGQVLHVDGAMSTAS